MPTDTLRGLLIWVANPSGMWDRILIWRIHDHSSSIFLFVPGVYFYGDFFRALRMWGSRGCACKPAFAWRERENRTGDFCNRLLLGCPGDVRQGARRGFHPG